MGPLHQMQITFVPEEDRLLFRVSVAGAPRAEFRLWLTRRYVQLVWRAILELLRKVDAPPGGGGGAPSSMAMAIEHQAAVSQADFTSSYEESEVFPLGEEPLLAVKVGIKSGPGPVPVLCLHTVAGQGVEFGVRRDVLHSFCRLLSEGSGKAGWGLNLDFSEASDLISKRGLN